MQKYLWGAETVPKRTHGLPFHEHHSGDVIQNELANPRRRSMGSVALEVTIHGEDGSSHRQGQQHNSRTNELLCNTKHRPLNFEVQDEK